MKKIAIVLPYFGEFPDYFRFWLESCKNNPSIDFFVFTDKSNSYQSSSNVKFVKKSFDQLKIEIQNLLDFTISLNSPYKLCDYKHFYGRIFKNYIEDYDFWAYCDCDMIFGDIRKYLTPELLSRYNYILAFGHLHL